MAGMKRTPPARRTILTLACCLLGALAAQPSGAAQFNLATLSCAGYHDALLDAEVPVPHPDSINFVMWLLGYSVAKSGAHVMYSDALASFGFALDAECVDHPHSSLLEAILRVKPRNDKPMDLATLNCREFQNRHRELKKSDPESADTIMNWLQGFAAAKAGSTVIDTDTLGAFEEALRLECQTNGQESLYDALVAVAAKHR